MGDRSGVVVLWLGAAGGLWLVREVIGLSDPAYYDPVTALDYAAAWTTSIAGSVTAAVLVVWWRHTPVRRGAWILVVAAVAFFLSALGNVLGDVYDLEIGETLWSAGAVGFAATVVTGLTALTVADPYRASGLFLVAFALGFGFPDSGGLWLAGVSLLGMAFWLSRREHVPGRA